MFAPRPPSVTARELATAIESGSAPVVLDVRSRAEFDAGRVPGAVNVPYWRLLFGWPRLPVPSAEPLVLYCGHGPRARMARAALRLRGYRRVMLMDGHWVAWQQAGLARDDVEHDIP